jgi:hypothetical protein
MNHCVTSSPVVFSQRKVRFPGSSGNSGKGGRVPFQPYRRKSFVTLPIRNGFQPLFCFFFFFSFLSRLWIEKENNVRSRMSNYQMPKWIRYIAGPERNYGHVFNPIPSLPVPYWNSRLLSGRRIIIIIKLAFIGFLKKRCWFW